MLENPPVRLILRVELTILEGFTRPCFFEVPRPLAAEADERPGPPTHALRTTARQASGRVDRRHNIKTTTVINSCAQYVSRVKTRASAPLPQVVPCVRLVRLRQTPPSLENVSQTAIGLLRIATRVSDLV